MVAKVIRQPIICVMGHVDSGKTTLLDSVRGSVVAKGEHGGITQHIGASEIPIDTIMSACGDLVDKIGVEITIPGLLFIDTPGHEAFMTLRKRGGAISDLAVLVIDINEGFQPQTDECLMFLKEFKTPFVVALTKIDRILGWSEQKNVCLADALEKQTDRTREELDKKLYSIVGQFSERGFDSERHDRVTDFAKQMSLIPVSGVTGEGIPDLLVVLAGLAQRYLKDRLAITPGEGKGTILEVKDFKGLGTTMDVILYDGEIRKGDYLVIGGKETVSTRVRALMKPQPLSEIRVEKRFIQTSSVHAAAGVKLAAPGIEEVVAGSPLRAVRTEKQVSKARQEVEQEISEVEIETKREGVILKADTLGSLEALTKSLKELEIPIRKAEVGDVTKPDVMELAGIEEPVIFAFGVKPTVEAEKLAKDRRVKVFQSPIIYKLMEDYDEWKKDSKKREELALLESATRPGKVRVLPGYVFRQSRPAVFGVEVIAGTVKPGYRMKLEKGDKPVGEVKELQSRGENVEEAVKGDKLALSMEGVVVGRHIREGDVLVNFLRKKDLEALEKLKARLRDDEKDMLEELNK